MFSYNDTFEMNKTRVRKANINTKLSETVVRFLLCDKTEQEDKVAEIMKKLHYSLI